MLRKTVWKRINLYLLTSMHAKCQGMRVDDVTTTNGARQVLVDWTHRRWRHKVRLHDNQSVKTQAQNSLSYANSCQFGPNAQLRTEQSCVSHISWVLFTSVAAAAAAKRSNPVDRKTKVFARFRQNTKMCGKSASHTMHDVHFKYLTKRLPI